MNKYTFEQHAFHKGEHVLYKGQPAEVISVHGGHGWIYLTVAFGPAGRGRNYATCGHSDIELALEQPTVFYSVLERHNDGSWWYHPGFTRHTVEEAELKFAHSFSWDLSRPHKIFRHEKPLPQEHSICTFDFKRFSFGGVVVWTETEGIVASLLK